MVAHARHVSPEGPARTREHSLILLLVVRASDLLSFSWNKYEYEHWWREMGR